jgi:hypothetical protein
VDALGEPATEAGGEGGVTRRPGAGETGDDGSQALFIVARGHPELLDQLRVVIGNQSGVAIIEDRRQRPRQDVSDESAREVRKRLREDGPADQG